MILDFIKNNLFMVVFMSVFLFAIYKFFIANDDEDSDSSSDEEGSDDSNTFVDDGRVKLRVLYGSQTGTAEDYAKMLQTDAIRYGFNAVSTCIAEYDPATDLTSDDSILVCVFATYGDGEPTDDARDFYDFLQNQNKSNYKLKNVKYTVFGLGNSQYKIYQGMARFVDKKFELFGATRLFKIGEGDADALMEETFEEWKVDMLSFLSQKYKTTPQEVKIEPKHNIKWLDHDNRLPFNTPRGIPDNKMPYLSKVTVNKQLLPEGVDRSTIHVEFDIKGTRIRYEAGDHLAVFPKNNITLLYKYASRLGVKDSMDKAFTMTPIEDEHRGHYFPREVTLKTALEHFVDLTHLTRKNFIRAMAAYASDKEEARELEEMASTSEKGKALFDKIVRKPGRLPIDMLIKYESVKLPLVLFVELMPRMAPRYYSIASSKGLHPESIHALVAVVRYEVPCGKREGVASTYLENLKVGEEAFIYVRESNFHLPPNTKLPVIMIGPGTGFAPLRGFLQQRRALKERRKELGDAHLFFGCRHRDEDFIYSDEMKDAQQEGIISNLHLAFSRDQEEKIYVQHLIAQNGPTIFKLLENGAYIYICGDAKYMEKEVNQTITKIIQTEGNFNEYDTIKYMQKLEKNMRYLKDVWAP